MKRELLLGNEAIVKAACDIGVNFVSGYPGSPAADIGDRLGKIAKNKGIYVEWSSNEKTALEAGVGASLSGLRVLVHMKSFGMNVCSDILFPLAYTGTVGGLVIVVADDPSCHSSAQSEQDSRGYAYLSHLPFLVPSDPQDCYDFTKEAFRISEKFKIPVVLRTTTRVAYQKGIVFCRLESAKEEPRKTPRFVKNRSQFVTMPPRVLEMKEELIRKLREISLWAENSRLNTTVKGTESKIGIITSGVPFWYTRESLAKLNWSIPILKLGFFNPLPQRMIKKFLKGKEGILVVEETDPYLEKEIRIIAKEVNSTVKISGKDILPMVGELNSDLLTSALLKLKGKRVRKESREDNISLPKRTPRLCSDCPYWPVLSLLKKLIPIETVIGGDIGCNMIGGLPPFELYDYIFCMGASIGVAHGVGKATGQKAVAVIGDGTFFHSGIEGLINAVYNRSNLLIVILDNRTTAMTGHQPHPGTGQNALGEETVQLDIEKIVRACGVEKVRTAETPEELEGTIKDFFQERGVSVIIFRKICSILAKKQKVE